jgi:hypothetical protein
MLDGPCGLQVAVGGVALEGGGHVSRGCDTRCVAARSSVSTTHNPYIVLLNLVRRTAPRQNLSCARRRQPGRGLRALPVGGARAQLRGGRRRWAGPRRPSAHWSRGTLSYSTLY